MYKKIKGIVINEYPFEENSKIINVFTEEKIIGILAKGAKKIKSPFFSTTARFNYSNFNIKYKENGLSTLVDSDTINNYSNIKKDIIKISYVTYITELVTKVYKHDNNKNIYYLYISCLNKINEGFNPRIITTILKLKLLDYLGVGISFNSCAKCGSTHNIVTIDPDIGGYICQNCYTNEILYDEKTLKMLRMYYLVDINTITDLKISDKVIKNINYFVNAYYDRYTGLYLKSKKFLNEMIS